MQLHIANNITSCDSGESTSWLAQHHIAAWTQNNSLSVAKNGSDFHTALRERRKKNGTQTLKICCIFA